MANVKEIVLENARLVFKNFSGKASRFNAEGNRNFCVVLNDEELIDRLERDGWNVKRTTPRDPDEDPLVYIKVSVKYDPIPPKIYMVTSKNKTLLNEDTVDELDHVEMKNVDLIIRPYEWEVNGKTGIKAYVKNMYVTIEEDYFAEKYSRFDAPDVDPDEDLPF